LKRRARAGETRPGPREPWRPPPNFLSIRPECGGCPSTTAC